jgi:hypothetical protein
MEDCRQLLERAAQGDEEGREAVIALVERQIAEDSRLSPYYLVSCRGRTPRRCVPTCPGCTPLQVTS